MNKIKDINMRVYLSIISINIQITLNHTLRKTLQNLNCDKQRFGFLDLGFKIFEIYVAEINAPFC